MLKYLERRFIDMGICAISGRKQLAGNNRSHSLRATRRVWNLNLQPVKFTDEAGHTHKVMVSARALRTLRKQER